MNVIAIMLYSGRSWNTWWANDIYCLYTGVTSKLARLDCPGSVTKTLFGKINLAIHDVSYFGNLNAKWQTGYSEIVSRNYFTLKGDSLCRNTVTQGDIAGCFFVSWRSERAKINLHFVETREENSPFRCRTIGLMSRPRKVASIRYSVTVAFSSEELFFF